MKTIKTFYLTKEFIKEELGIENVVGLNSVVSLMNNRPVFAKNFKWNSIDDLKEDDMFKDIKAIGGCIILYEIDMKSYKEYKETSDGSRIIFDYEYEFVDDVKNADEIIVRLFECK